MEHSITYKKISLEDNLSGLMELMKIFPEPEQNSEEELRKELTENKKPYGIWLAKNEIQRDIGFSIWHHFQESESWFWLTAVKHGYRGLGVGAKLLDLAVRDVSELRYKKMFLETFESCKGMVKLCKQRGFRELERVPYHWAHAEDKRIKYVLEFHPLAMRE